MSKKKNTPFFAIKKHVTINGVRYNFGNSGITSVSVGTKNGMPRLVIPTKNNKKDKEAYIHGQKGFLYYKQNISKTENNKIESKEEVLTLDLSEDNNESKVINPFLKIAEMNTFKSIFEVNEGQIFDFNYCGVKDEDWILPEIQ